MLYLKNSSVTALALFMIWSQQQLPEEQESSHYSRDHEPPEVTAPPIVEHKHSPANLVLWPPPSDPGVTLGPLKLRNAFWNLKKPLFL